MDLQKRVQELSDELLKAQKAYYVDGRPLMSDLEYDGLFDELSAIEREHPEEREFTDNEGRFRSHQ